MTTLDPTQTMDITLTDRHREISAKARRYCDTYLLPLEERCDERDGLGAEDLVEARAAVVEMELNGINMPKAWGGQEYSSFEQMLAHEQLGRATNALWDVPWRPSNVLRYATPEQVSEYVRPEIAGKRRHAYAITEEGAGSDVDAIASTVRRDGDDYVLNGVKMHVTSFNTANYILFQGKIAEGEHAGEHAMLFVDHDTPGIRVVRVPRYSHTYADQHAIVAFEDVRVPASNLIGSEGDGLAFTYEWFRYERLMIAARCCGAAERLVEEATAFAKERVQFGRAIFENQAIAHMLADSLTELWAARLMTYRLAENIDAGLDVKLQHTQCSMAKLYASEMAGRVADRAVQIFGGRGYMRENVAERFWRELRVDRIWEGTSEIQRNIVADQLAKRGVLGLLG